MVGEGEFGLQLIGLKLSGIKLKPLNITWFDHSTRIPIEFSSLVATQCKTIVDIETEHDRLVGSYLHIELSDIFVNDFVNNITHEWRDVHCKVEPCRDGDCTLCNDAIVAIYSSTQCNVSCLVTIIYEGNIRRDIELCKQFICNAIPFGSTCLLVIFYATLKSNSFFTSGRINQCRDLFSSQLYISFEVCRNIIHQIICTLNSIWVQFFQGFDRSWEYRHRHQHIRFDCVRCNQAIVDHLINYLTSRYRYRDESSIFRIAIRQD